MRIQALLKSSGAADLPPLEEDDDADDDEGETDAGDE
jgi:hypothetical protein